MTKEFVRGGYEQEEDTVPECNPKDCYECGFCNCPNQGVKGEE